MERTAANDARPSNTTPTTHPHPQIRAMTTTAIVGWAGTLLVIASYAQPTVRRLRRMSVAASLVLITFNLLLGIWSNVVLEVALVLINIARLSSAAEARRSTDRPAAQTLPESLSHSYERQFQ